jgi:tetratricopeptide (TPR) repeat protein
MGAKKTPERAETSDPRSDLLLSLDAAQRIDSVCERFERALAAGSSAAVEVYLAETADPGLERSALLRELLALEVEYRLRRGQQPTRDEYLKRFPSQQPIVDLVLQESTDGRPEAVPAFLVDHPRYHVLRLLASGGMGSVYLAEHRRLQRPVALKIVNPALLTDQRAIDRFDREARAAACLSHPNVVTVYDAETAAGHHFLVMQYVAGSDLARRVRERGPLAIALACEYVRQAALGLQHAHERGLVHRDVTPRNLMLTEEGQIKVLDFGLACFVSETSLADRAAVAGALLGSIDYMAPEQAADPHAADVRADIYGLGCTLYFLLSGRPPFPEGTRREKIDAHAQRLPPPIESLAKDTPPELLRLLERMLAKSPADRPQTPAEVAAALAPFAATADRVPPPETGRRGRRAWIWALAASVVGVAILGGLLLTRPYVGWGPPRRNTTDAGLVPTEAHRLYREGLLLMGQRQEPQMRLAVKRLEDATKLEPTFALAFTALADAYNLCGDYGWAMADDVLPKAEQSARTAMALDDHLAEAHLALALALEAYDLDWKQAEAEYRRALDLNPKLPAAHHWYAWFLVQQGRPEEAASHIDKAQQFGPDEVIIANNVGKIHYLCRQYPLAVEKHKYALELNPDFRKAHRDLGLVYAEMGRLDDALREFDQAKGLTEDGRDLDAARAYAYARNGRGPQARALLLPLESLADHKPLAYEIATIYAALADRERALDWLERAFREHSAARSGMAIDPRLDGVRRDPQFLSLLKQVGLPVPR